MLKGWYLPLALGVALTTGCTSGGNVGDTTRSVAPRDNAKVERVTNNTQGGVSLEECLVDSSHIDCINELLYEGEKYVGVIGAKNDNIDYNKALKYFTLAEEAISKQTPISQTGYVLKVVTQKTSMEMWLVYGAVANANRDGKVLSYNPRERLNNFFNDYKRIKKDADNLLSKVPEHAKSFYSMIAEYHNGLGILNIVLGNKQEANKQFSMAYNLNPLDKFKRNMANDSFERYSNALRKYEERVSN